MGWCQTNIEGLHSSCRPSISLKQCWALWHSFRSTRASLNNSFTGNSGSARIQEHWAQNLHWKVWPLALMFCSSFHTSMHSLHSEEIDKNIWTGNQCQYVNFSCTFFLLQYLLSSGSSTNQAAISNNSLPYGSYTLHTPSFPSSVIACLDNLPLRQYWQRVLEEAAEPDEHLGLDALPATLNRFNSSRPGPRQRKKEVHCFPSTA